MWFYLDDEGAEQGPVPQEVVLAWLEQGFVRPSLMVRREGEPSATPVGEHYAMAGVVHTGGNSASNSTGSGEEAAVGKGTEGADGNAGGQRGHREHGDPTHPSLHRLFFEHVDMMGSGGDAGGETINEVMVRRLFEHIQYPIEDMAEEGAAPIAVPARIDWPGLKKFVSTHAPEVLSAPMWCYRDDEDAAQGPVPEALLVWWLEQGFVESGLLVRSEHFAERPFTTMAKAGLAPEGSGSGGGEAVASSDRYAGKLWCAGEAGGCRGGYRCVCVCVCVCAVSLL